MTLPASLSSVQKKSHENCSGKKKNFTQKVLMILVFETGKTLSSSFCGVRTHDFKIFKDEPLCSRMLLSVKKIAKESRNVVLSPLRWGEDHKKRLCPQWRTEIFMQEMPRQFVENPLNNKFYRRSCNLVDKLLLEKFFLAEISRVTGIYKVWIQNCTNKKYEDIPKRTEDILKKRFHSAMR